MPQGLLPKSSLDKAEAAYKTQQVGVDRHRSSVCRRDEMARLDQGIIPPMAAATRCAKPARNSFNSNSTRLPPTRRSGTQKSVDRLHKKIEGLPKLQRHFLRSRQSESNETELKLLVDKLGRAEREQMAKSKEFVTIADDSAWRFRAIPFGPLFSWRSAPASARCLGWVWR